MNPIVQRVVRRFRAGHPEVDVERVGVMLDGMADVVAARRAKATLKDRLGHVPWLRGIGIAGEHGNYCVKVNVDAVTDEVQGAVPSIVDGVRVIIDPVGNIRAL